MAVFHERGFGFPFSKFKIKPVRMKFEAMFYYEGENNLDEHLLKEGNHRGRCQVNFR